MADEPKELVGSDVDLSRLRDEPAVQRGTARIEQGPPAWRTWWPVIAAGALAVGLIVATLVPVLEPVEGVRVAPVVFVDDVEARRTTSAFQATGWAEPDPFPVRIAPQIPGVIAELPVVEGTPLVAGETVVAKLDTTLIDAEIAEAERAVERADADLARAVAEVGQVEALRGRNLEARLRVAELDGTLARLRQDQAEAEADRAAARADRAQNAANRATLAQRERELAQLQASLADHTAKAQALDRRIGWLRANAEALRENVASDGATELQALSAEADLATAVAERDGHRAQAAAIERSIVAANDGVAAARDAANEPVALDEAVALAAAKVTGLAGQIAAITELRRIAAEEADDALTFAARQRVAESARSSSAARLAEARAMLDRLTIRRRLHTVIAPIDGEVLKVLAMPGSMIGGEAEVKLICTAFDPDEIQVRVDLPLSDVPAVEVGQRVEISSDAVPGHTYAGVVTRFVRQADLARNSLQVKVRVTNPDGRLKPDMLTRCRFLPIERPRRDGEAADDDDAAGPRVSRAFVPQEALIRTEGGDAVFIVDPRSGGAGGRTGRARHILVTQLPDIAGPPDHVAVDGALRPGYRVILAPSSELRDGARVKSTAVSR
jgi:HlyD family secretion protein